MEKGPGARHNIEEDNCAPSVNPPLGVGGAFVETVSESELRAADTATRNPKGLHHQPDDVSDPRSRCLRDVCQGEREGGKGRKRIFAILRISLPFFCASAADSRKRRTFQPSSSGFFLLSSTVCILKAEAMPSSYVWTKKNCFRQHCVQPPLSVFRFYGNKVSLHSRRFSFLKGTSVW